MKYLLAISLIFVCFHSNGQLLGDNYYGIASHYAENFYGKITANGDTLNKKEFTAAHKSLPFNTLLEVVNLKNNRSVIVRINDRGPYIPGRIIDLAEASAKEINLIKRGTTPVKITIIGFNNTLYLKPSIKFEIKENLKLSGKFYEKSKLKQKKVFEFNYDEKETIKTQFRRKRMRDLP